MLKLEAFNPVDFLPPKSCSLLKIQSWKRFVTCSVFLDKISIWHLSSVFLFRNLRILSK